MLPCKTTKGESLHIILTAIVEFLYTNIAILRYPVTMKVHIRRSNTLEVYWIKIISLNLLETGKEGSDLNQRDQEWWQNYYQSQIECSKLPQQVMDQKENLEHNISS